MRYRQRLLIVVAAAASLLAHGPALFAADPADKGAAKPPAKALVALDKLKPAVSKPTVAPDSDVPKRAQKAVEKARTLIAEGKYSLAVPLLVERALGFAPNSAEVHRLLAEAYIQLPDAGKALVHMQKTVKLDGDSIVAQIRLAQLLLAQKRNDQAIVALRTALVCSQAKPDNPRTGEALFRLGKLLEEEGYLRAALDCFNTLGENIDKYGRKYASRPVLRSIVLRPQRLLARRGGLLMKINQPKQAAPLLKRAFDRDRTNAPLAELLVEALTAAKQFDQIEKVLVDLAGQPSLQKKIPALAAKIAVGSGDKAMPMRIWKSLQAAKRQSGDLAVALAGAADKLGAPDQSAAILKSVMDSTPGDASVTKHVVASYAAQGDGDKVLASLARLLRADPAGEDVVDEQLSVLAKSKVAKDFARKFAGTIASKPKPQQASLHYLTARFGRLQGEKSLPLEQYAKAIAADPAFLPTYARLADIYGKKKDKAKLADLLKQFKKLPAGRETAAYYYALGKVHLAMSNASEAIKALMNARKLDRKYTSAIEALGDALLLSGRSRDAVVAYQLVASLAPKRSGLNRRFFDAYMAARAFKDARRVAEEELKNAPQSREAKIILAKVFVAAGINDKAAKLLDELNARTSDDQSLRLMAIRVDLAGSSPVMFKKDFDRTVAALKKIAAADKPDSEAASVMARVMRQNGQYEQAAATWAEILKIRKDDNLMRMNRLYALVAAGKYAPAIKAIEELRETLPDDARLETQLFMCLELSGEHDRAEKLMKERLSKATDAKKAHNMRVKLVQFLQDAKLYDRMQAALDDWILVDSRLGSALKRYKIDTYIMAEKYPQAVAYAEKVMVRSSWNHDIKVKMAGALVKSKAYDKAHKLFDKWVAEHRKKRVNRVPWRGLDAEPVDPAEILAELQGFKVHAYVAAGKYDQADTYLDARLKENPLAISGRLKLIAALDEAKEYDRAVARLDAWVKNAGSAATTKPADAKTDAKTKRLLAWCKETTLRVLVSKKDYAELVKRADRYIADDPKNTDMLRLRASALNELKKPEKALEDMRKMYKIKPDFSGHWNNLGYQLADLGLELPEAERLIRRSLNAIEISSVNYVPPLDSLAWALYKQGKLHAAGRVFLDVIKRGRELKYSHPILFDHAGDGFYRLGWTDRAIELWTEAVKLAAEDKTDAYEVLEVRRNTLAKIKAAKAGKKVSVAPLGKGIKIQDK